MWKPNSIVSGGQTGVDRAALDVAILLSIPHGGWCPKDRIAEDGTISKKYSLKETPLMDVSQRTEWNVRDSDGTLILVVGDLENLKDGTIKTIEFCEKHDKHMLIIDLNKEDDPTEVKKWAKENSIQNLNIAGPRESSSPGIYNRSKKFLKLLFEDCCS